MRSRTSRGVPEWSGGEELYIGSAVFAIEKVLGVTGIVQGPPEGSRGSTRWGHLSRRAPWAEVGREPAPSGLGAPPWASPHAPRVANPRVGGLPTCLGGQGTPPGRRPPSRWDLGRCPPSQGAYIKGGREGSNISALGASLLPCNTSPSRRSSAKPCRDPLHPPPRRRAAGSPSTSPSPLLDQEGGDVAAPYVC